MGMKEGQKVENITCRRGGTAVYALRVDIPSREVYESRLLK